MVQKYCHDERNWRPAFMYIKNNNTRREKQCLFIFLSYFLHASMSICSVCLYTLMEGDTNSRPSPCISAKPQPTTVEPLKSLCHTGHLSRSFSAVSSPTSSLTSQTQPVSQPGSCLDTHKTHAQVQQRSHVVEHSHANTRVTTSGWVKLELRRLSVRVSKRQERCFGHFPGEEELWNKRGHMKR